MAEWCSLPSHCCISSEQITAYFTNKRWLVCLASVPPQINNINALQILVFSLITKLVALCLNPQQSWRMKTTGCIYVCAYQLSNIAILLSAWREYFVAVWLLLFILIDTSNSILLRKNSYLGMHLFVVWAAEYECVYTSAMTVSLKSCISLSLSGRIVNREQEESCALWYPHLL